MDNQIAKAFDALIDQQHKAVEQISAFQASVINHCTERLCSDGHSASVAVQISHSVIPSMMTEVVGEMEKHLGGSMHTRARAALCTPDLAARLVDSVSRAADVKLNQQRRKMQQSGQFRTGESAGFAEARKRAAMDGNALGGRVDVGPGHLGPSTSPTDVTRQNIKNERTFIKDASGETVPEDMAIERSKRGYPAKRSKKKRK